jgi:hypothetical protein
MILSDHDFAHDAGRFLSYLLPPCDACLPVGRGEGWDGRRLRGPLARRGVDILDLSPPTLILPLGGGRKLFFDSIGVIDFKYISTKCLPLDSRKDSLLASTSLFGFLARSLAASLGG